MAADRPDIGIIYYEKSFDPSELIEIEEDLSKCGLKFSPHERSPYINASIDFFVPLVQILLSPDMVNAVCQGLLTNATWGAIKALLIHIFRKFRNKPVFKLQGGNVTEEIPNIHFVIGNNVLALPMNVDEEKFKYVVDKFMDISASSVPEKVTYTLYSDEENAVMQKTEDDIIQEEYKKWLEKKNLEQEVK